MTELCGFVIILSGTFLLHKTKDMIDAESKGSKHFSCRDNDKFQALIQKLILTALEMQIYHRIIIICFCDFQSTQKTVMGLSRKASLSV